MGELKPCPFCGGNADVQPLHYRCNTQHFIKCSKCYVKTTTYDRRKESVAAWNRRADAVVHGKWIPHYDNIFPADSTLECSACHARETVCLRNENYCPNCGAKMDGGVDDAVD